MSLVVLTAFLTFSTTNDPELGPLPNWSLGQPRTEASSKPRNEIRLDGSQLFWNGAEASESQVRNYLSIAKQLDPQPLTVFSYGAGVPPERVQRVRALLDEALHCEPATCLEITPPEE